MLHSRSYRIGKNPDLREINNRLGRLRPFQVRGFSVSNRQGDEGELILLHDEKEAPNLIETHPSFGSVINIDSGPDHFLMLFDIPIAQAELQVNGTNTTGNISGDIVEVPTTGNTSGEFILTGRVQSQDGIWSDSDCLAAYSLASTAPHSGIERPNHLDDGRIKCINLSVDGRNTSMDVQNTLMKKRGIRADEIVAFAKEKRGDLVDNAFMLHRSPSPPSIVRIYPGHGASLPSGGNYNIAVAFDKKLSEANWGKIYVDDVDRTSAVTLHDAGFSLTLPIIEGVGTHSIRFESIRARNGEARKFAIISSFTIMPIEWTNPPSVDLTDYYTKLEVDALIPNDYYTQSEIGAILQSYYLSSEVDQLFLTHATSTDHDGRYYTESEVDTLLTGYSITSHLHTGIYDPAGTAAALTHDGFTDFVANEHIDWTQDQGATNINTGNIPDLSGLYQFADADLTALAGITGSDGDIIIRNGGTWTRLPAGSSGYVLKVNTGIPNWEAEGGGEAHTLDSATHTDVAAQTNVRGDLLVINASTNWDALPIGTTGQFLITDGVDPSWTTLVANDIPDLSGSYSVITHDHAGVYDPAGTAAALTHDGFSDFVANEHLDWTTDQGVTNIHSGNIPDLSGSYDPVGTASGEMGTHESTYNHANYDTAYNWGDHSGAGYLTGETSHTDVVVDGDFTSDGILKRTSAGVYGIITDASANWNSAYEWGNHSGLYDLIGAAAALTHDGFTDFVVNEHIDWTTDQGATNLHANNIPDLSGTYEAAGTAASVVGSHESTYNHANYNTAYGWGDHGAVGYLTGETSHADVVVDGDFTSDGILKRTSSGAYGIITDASANWNTAYEWGSHAGLYEIAGSITTHSSSGDHDGRYYTETELNTGQLDTRYYTESEVDGLISGISLALNDINNVIVPTPNSGEFLKFDGTNWINAGIPGGISTLAALDDTLISGPSDGEYLRWDGSDWTNEDPETRFSTTGHLHTGVYDPAGTASSTVGTHESTFNHSNYNTAYGWGDHAGLYYTQDQLNTGQLNTLYYTESEIDSLLTGYSATSHAHNDQYYTETEIDNRVLNDINNVVTPTPNSGEFLKFDGSNWINAGIPGGISTLAALDDTLITSPADGHYLRWDGNDWIDEDPESRFYTETEVSNLLDAKSDTGHIHSASDITTGQFDDARISESSVTQYTGAINHDALTGFVSNKHIDWSATGAEDVHVDRIPDLSGTYSTVGHNHNDAYYTETEIDNRVLDNLNDVVATAPNSGEFLKFDGTNWINAGIPGGISTLAALDDTSITTPSDGYYLRWNGSDWVDENPESRFSLTGHLHTGIYDPAGTAAALTHDGFTDYVANEHLDWTSDLGATNVHANNIPDLSGTYSTTGHLHTGIYDPAGTAAALTHDGFADFVANEHLDWTSDLGPTNVHANNIPDLSSIYSTTGHLHTGIYDPAGTAAALTHDGFADFVTNEHLDWTVDQGATNVHAGNIPDLSGTYDVAGAASTAVGTHESTYNHANYSTAYGWGNHASVGYLTGETSHTDVVVDGDFASDGILKRTSAGVYGIIADASANWNSAYEWGNHSGLYDLAGTAAALTHDGFSDFVANEHIDWTSDVSPANVHINNIPDLSGTYDQTGTASGEVSAHESTYNHANFATAYEWGNHAGLYDPAGTAAALTFALDDLTDVISPFANSGEFLKFDGTNWINAGIPGGISTLAALDDTEITTPSDGYYLRWNGADWADEDPETRFSTTGHLHAGIYDPSGTAASAVSGHESTYNHSNYNTAYGWGNHASAGYLTGETSHADVVVDGDFASDGILKRTAAGVYGIITDASANWNTAHGWGNHAGLYVKLDGTVSLSAAWDAGSYQIRAESFQSDIATGTAPFVVASTTAVDNLNADLLDGNHASAFAVAGHNHAGVYDPAGTAAALTHDGFSDFVANEHLDWTVDLGATNLHINNIPDLSSAYDPAGTASGEMSTHEGTYNHANFATAYEWGNHVGLYDPAGTAGALTHDGFADFVANEHRDWTADQGATNIHAGNIPDLSGTYDIAGAASTAVGSHESTYSHANYNTAYGWGNHASAGYLTGETSHSNVVVDGDFTSNGILKRTAAGVYGIVTDNSTNWNTAYGWGTHVGLYDAAGTAAALTHDGFTDFVAAEHIDWTQDQGATNINTGNIPDLSGVYDPSGTAASAVSSHEGTYNHANYNTAYGWGDHAGLYIRKDGTVALTGAWDAGSFQIRAETFQSDVATGTAPLTVASTTAVTNLNADLLDGNHAAAFALSGHNHTGVYDPAGTASGLVGTHESTYNHGNYNTAYGWGNHASAGYLTGETSHTDVVVDGDFTSDGILKRTSAGVYGVITDASANWDTAYGWGDHAEEGYLTGETSHADVIVDGDFASNGILKRTAAGVYGIVTDASANWNTAYGWGDHAGLYYTQTQLDTGQLNTLYYTESEVDALIPYTHPYEPNGFLIPGGESPDTTITYDDGAGTITIAPTGASFTYYSEGNEFTVLAASPIVVTMTQTEGIHWVYIDGSGNPQVTNGIPAGSVIGRYCLVTQYYWDATNNVSIIRGDERHGIQMDGGTHRYLHETIGCVWEKGLALNGYTIATDTDNAVRIGWSAGEVHDEDIDFDIDAGIHPAEIAILYRLGASNWRKKTPDTYPYLEPGITDYPAGTYPAYNDENGGDWKLTDVGNNNYFNMWIFATTDMLYPIMAIPSQSAMASIASAEDEQFSDLNLSGLPTPEVKIIWKLIYQAKSTFANTHKVELIEVIDYRGATLLGSSGYIPISHASLADLITSGHPASIISAVTTSFGGILSGSDTSVQLALDTLDDHTHDDRYYTESEIDSAGYLTGETSHADVVVDGDFTSNGILKRTAAGVYGIVTDNSANWDTAYGWGDHTTLYDPAGTAAALTHDGFADYVANEHLDWTADQGTTNVHANNIPDLSGTYSTTGHVHTGLYDPAGTAAALTHDGFSDFVANEHLDWTSDQGATNIHAGNIPDLSGVYESVDASILRQADVDDTPVNGVTTAPISSNWAHNHVTAADPHSVYPLESEVLKKDGTVALTANWDVGAYGIRALTFESDVAAGTAPFVVASNTAVTNLNADLLDGNEASAFALSSHAHTASAIASNTGNFGGVLDGSDDTVQKCLDTLDDHIHESYAYIKIQSGTDFTPGTGAGSLQRIEDTVKEIGVRIDIGNESIQINIGDTIFKAALTS